MKENEERLVVIPLNIKEGDTNYAEAWVLGAVTSWGIAVQRLRDQGHEDLACQFMTIGAMEFGRIFVDRAELMGAVPESWRTPSQ